MSHVSRSRLSRQNSSELVISFPLSSLLASTCSWVKRFKNPEFVSTGGYYSKAKDLNQAKQKGYKIILTEEAQKTKKRKDVKKNIKLGLPRKLIPKSEFI
jgi:hypothetical protein